MIFEWDEEKRGRNIAKHAIDFVDCPDVFAGPTVSVPDDRSDYGETRFVTFGLLGGCVVAIAHTETTESIRVISMRKARNVSKRSSSKRSRTNLKRLGSLKSQDIDLSDLPEVTPERFARAVVREGLAPLRAKEQITLRLDSDVLTWFRAQGKGYQTKINSLLRAYMEASNRK